jgi:hypothetical protein
MGRKERLKEMVLWKKAMEHLSLGSQACISHLINIIKRFKAAAAMGSELSTFLHSSIGVA